MLKIKFKTDNAAFQDGGTHEECARILRQIADQLEEGYTSSPKVLDFNGNHVGHWDLSGERYDEAGELIDGSKEP